VLNIIHDPTLRDSII